MVVVVVVTVAVGVTDLKERTVLHYNIIHVKRLEVGKAFRKRNEVSRIIGAMELEQVRPVWVVVTGPTKLLKSLFQLSVRTYYLVRRKVDKDLWTCPG